MKKFLLSAVALLATMSVNAQEFCAFNADDNADFAAIGLTSDKMAVVGGTIIGKTESVVAKIGADDDYKSSSIGTITVGEASINGGLQGNTNPKDADGGVPSSTLIAPAGGAFYVFEVAKDGYLYIFQNSSSNKSYTVFEEGEAIGYVFSAYWKNGVLPTGAGVYSYELKGGGEYNQLKDAGITSVLWPEEYVIGESYNKDETVNAKGETGKGYGDGGLGVIKFPVFKDCKYIVNANGSKMTASGFYFDETGDAKVSITVDDAEVVLLGGVAGEVWTVAGTKPLCDNSWDPSDTKCVMKTTDGVNYTYTKADIVLEKGTTYEFKIVKGHEWGEEYPSQNFTFDVDETAKYKVTITFNSETKDIDAVPVKTGEAEAAEHVYSVIGTINGNWDVDTDMTKGADGLYAAVFEGVNAGDYKFKVRVDHDWSVAYPSSDYAFNVESDGSTVTITFNEESKEVKATVTTADGIQVVKALTNVAVIYNLAGQKVNNNYKGVVVINGKKMIQK